MFFSVQRVFQWCPCVSHIRLRDVSEFSFLPSVPGLRFDKSVLEEDEKPQRSSRFNEANKVLDNNIDEVSYESSWGNRWEMMFLTSWMFSFNRSVRRWLAWKDYLLVCPTRSRLKTPFLIVWTKNRTVRKFSLVARNGRSAGCWSKKWPTGWCHSVELARY